MDDKAVSELRQIKAVLYVITALLGAIVVLLWR